MRAKIRNQVLFIHSDDVPSYKKQGSVVRNSYFWALRSIADRANFNQSWEFDETVWHAVARMLMSFTESGYLGYRETILEFYPEDRIPPELTTVATWSAPEDEE